MDVVPDAGSVRGFVIRPENLHIGPLAGGDVEDQRDQVRFRIVALAYVGIGVSPGGVEIAKVDVFDPVGIVVVLEDLLDHELAPAVGIDGRLGVVFRERNALRHAVGGTGGRKDNVRDMEFAHCIEEVHGVHNVVAIVFRRIGDRLAHVGEAAKVHNGLDRVLAEAEPELLAVGEVAQDEVAPSDEGAVAVDQVVEDYRVVAALAE